MSLVDKKLIALNKGNPFNSTGKDVAEAVNESIDAIVALQNADTSVEEDILDLQSRTTTNEQDIDNLETEQITLDSRITDVETLSGDNEQSITQLQEDLTNKTHESLVGRGDQNQHPASSISTDDASDVQTKLTSLENDSKTDQDVRDLALQEIISQWQYTYKGTFSSGFIYDAAKDVGIHSNGKAYEYVGSNPLPVTIVAGTDPTASGDYSEVDFSSIKNLSDLEEVTGLNTVVAREVDLATAITDDAPVGTRYVITDLDNAHYDVVEASDTGGWYKEGLISGRKLRLIEQNINTPENYEYTDGDVTSFFDNANILNGNALSLNRKSYSINKAFATVSSPIYVYGNGAEFVKDINGAAQFFTFSENGYYENFNVRSTFASIPQIRTEPRSNSTLINIGVYDNKDGENPLTADAWGFYFKNVSNVSLYDCKASGNTQSDFTIVDNVLNVNIYNPSKGTGNSCKLNVEPNDPSLGGVESLNIFGGELSEVTILEPFILGDSIKSMTIRGANIENFLYRGGNLCLQGCEILNVNGAELSSGTWIAGQLTGDLYVGANIIQEPSFFDISRDDAQSYWTVISNLSPTYGTRYLRSSNNTGKYIRINPDRLNGYVGIKNRDPIDIDVNTSYVLTLMSAKDQTDEVSPQVVEIEYLNSSDVVLGGVPLWFNSKLDSSQTDTTIETCVISPVTGAVKINLIFGRKVNSQVSFDLYSVSLNKITNVVKAKTINDVRNDIIEEANKSTYVLDHIPTTTAGFYYPNYLKGEEVVISNPSSGNPYKYVNTLEDSEAGDFVVFTTLP